MRSENRIVQRTSDSVNRDSALEKKKTKYEKQLPREEIHIFAELIRNALRAIFLLQSLLRHIT